MFFEALDRADEKGEIGVAISTDSYHWHYEKIVLAELFHSAYPYVFEWENEYYMIPETYESNSVRLYRASRFPFEWEFVQDLISDECYVDSSLVYFNHYWWLFTASITWDTLHLYYAKTLTGEWIKHPQSPVIAQDKSTARPGGRVVVAGGKVIRYAQDDHRVYGEKVRAFEVITLTPTAYQEQEAAQSPVLIPSGSGWNAIGMHTIDPHEIGENQWLACVDGVQAQSVSQWFKSL